MARSIPTDFNVNTEVLDPHETFVRDILRVNVNNWAKFRLAIGVGNDTKHLKNSSGSEIDSALRAMFVEFPKTYYEIINSLGYAKECFNEIRLKANNNTFHFFRHSKEFYMHLGSVLDNIGRLTFMIYDKDALIKKSGHRLLRHAFHFGDLKKKDKCCELPKQVKQLIESSHLEEIQCIRNNYVHNWRPFMDINKEGKLCYPEEMRKENNYLWAYEEKQEWSKKYTYITPVYEFLLNDFLFVENFQDSMFSQLITDIEFFEKNHSIEIT